MEVTISVQVDVEKILDSMVEARSDFAEFLAQWILDDPDYFINGMSYTTRKRLIEIFREED